MAVSGLKPRTLSAVTVVTAGTEVQLSATQLLVYYAMVVSLSSNTGTQYIGDSSVSSTNGIPIPPDGAFEIEAPAGARGVDQFDLSKWYVDSSTNGAEFRVIAWIRE